MRLNILVEQIPCAEFSRTVGLRILSYLIIYVVIPSLRLTHISRHRALFPRTCVRNANALPRRDAAHLSCRRVYTTAYPEVPEVSRFAVGKHNRLASAPLSYRREDFPSVRRSGRVGDDTTTLRSPPGDRAVTLAMLSARKL